MNNNSSGQRKLSIYEQNQLLEVGLKEKDLLSKGEMPVEYLTGRVKFKNLEIKVNSDVLIPRVETEDLVDLIILDIRTRGLNNIEFLELGLGSGVISLAVLDFCLKANLKIKMTGIDYSRSALKVAKENFSKHFSSFKIELIESDLLNELKQNRQFDFIVANLPYIPTQQLQTLDTSVKDFEPLLALDGGADGFSLIARLLQQILENNYLKIGGKIYLEVDSSHDQNFVRENYPKLWQSFNWQFKKDHFDRNRFIVLLVK